MKYKSSNYHVNVNNYCSKLSIIDLAGSEKFLIGTKSDQKNSGLIRKSLLNLKLFINNLHNGTSDGSLQCRNSLLTKLIKDIVTNRQYNILVIANIHTGVENMFDSKTTLKDTLQFRNIHHQFKNNKKVSCGRSKPILLQPEEILD